VQLGLHGCEEFLKVCFSVHGRSFLRDKRLCYKLVDRQKGEIEGRCDAVHDSGHNSLHRQV
jgi:hypothetical protein